MLYLIMICISAASFANEQKQVELFNATSYQNILEDKKNKPFLLVLWSLDCSPCMEELDVLRQLAKQYPGINLIFISTDTTSQTEEIIQLMTKYELDNFQQWVFSDDSVQHLRFAIDPAWYGELPRSYFHSKEGKRHAVTGRLNHQLVGDWLRAL